MSHILYIADSHKVHDLSILRVKIILPGDQVWKMARMTKRPSQYIPERQSRLKGAFSRTKLVLSESTD